MKERIRIRHDKAAGLGFMQSNVAASQSSAPLDVLGLAGNTEFTVPLSGRIRAISIASNAARTGGTLSIVPTVDGTAKSIPTAKLDGTNTTYHYGTSEWNDSPYFTVGQRIGVKITTDASWAPITANVVVTVFIELEE